MSTNASIPSNVWDYEPGGNRTWQRRGSVETYYTYDAGNELLRSHALPADDFPSRFARGRHGRDGVERSALKTARGTFVGRSAGLP
jgi:hypothetical protein